MSDRNPLAERFPDAPPCVHCERPRAEHSAAGERCPGDIGAAGYFYDGRWTRASERTP